MTGSLILVHLAGAVALLLWATHMVRTNVEDAYGDRLRLRLRHTLKNPVLAVAAGGLLAIAFQSATAVSLLVASFAGSGIVSGTTGLMAVLGADLGSAFVVKLLSYDLSLLVPVFLFAGTMIFLSAERRAWRSVGSILVGVGLMILSLRLIGEASEPLRESRLLPVVVNYLSSDPVTAFLLAALATWLFHSSVAFILLIAALAARGLVPAELGVVMVLGANLGGGLVAAALSRTMQPSSRAVPFGNLALRSAGAVLALAGLILFAPPLGALGATAPLQIVHAHIVFNAALVVFGLPVAGFVSRAIERLIAGSVAKPRPALEDREASALDPDALGSPSRALANVSRAVVGVCETIEVMLKTIMELYEDADPARMEALAALDDRVDRKHAAIKLYLAKISTKGMSDDEARRTRELLEGCVKLEQVGDIVVRNMLVHVRKKLDRHLTFTPEGWRELSDLHEMVMANARLAFNVLISRDPETAFQLVQEKDRLRDLERQTSQRHFERLREGTAKSIETSALHLDTIRDLKQINSLLASIAYPVLEEHGLIGRTRLRAAE
jgi:phosphate:Na+ symporter